ncbi:hypothetical protein CGQ24_07345 [Arthrobacter sp. 7749]|nr:hypothetical protein CGQ24_07345 [Arthrobacter sp. 7749]
MTELAQAFAASTGQPYYDLTKGEQHRGQASMAYRLAALYGGRLKYVRRIGWYIWDGARWAADEKDTSTTAVLDVLRDALSESLGNNDLQADVRRCETANGIAGVLSIASALPELRAGASELDADPYLINCANGTLDLRTGQLRSHDPADLITKVTRSNYNGDALNPAWDGFLESSLPDREVREFLQRFTGSALIGTPVDHILVIATGIGRNGKGVYSRAVSKALGDYAITGSNSMLIATKYGQQSAGEQASRMRLRGARWVVMAELEKGAKLAPSTMKSLTGGDTIEAKFMGQNPVEFAPSHSIFMETNYLPTVDAEDTAVWARLRVVPFDVSFAGREDKSLEDRLEAGLDAVLSWAVAGLRAYHQEGLNAPQAVLSRTGAYRTANDPVQQFVNESCVFHTNARVTRTELHHAYLEWARTNGAESLTPRELTPRVRVLEGVSEGKSGGKELWKGLGLESDKTSLD